MVSDQVLQVREAVAGVVVPQGDPEALARTILELTSNLELCEEYGRNGRRFVQERLQWSQLVSNWTSRLQLRREASVTVPDSSRA